ncbi:hypothetical protein [Thalassococcus sp. S3]|uniref:hypothetical protein n=1 Tax=Thalassococcus sp. S3 TaxID=2017482 RepID=UPI00102AC36B|nr:hypothetical protein [Thalassococcus sp. S3]
MSSPTLHSGIEDVGTVHAWAMKVEYELKSTGPKPRDETGLFSGLVISKDEKFWSRLGRTVID